MKYLVFIGLLAGCAAEPALISAPIPYRNPTQPVASKALFDFDRAQGDWHVMAEFPDGVCVATQVQISATLFTRHCADGTLIGGGITQIGPGRLRIGAQGSEQYWVLWTDDSYRTMVLADPNGRLGWILNRDSQISADRMQAAREILDFNGYDVSRLVEVSQ
ncbi:lipocalin family protein [Aestuariibius sp. HNIBRBA575]|uniref:lipocalin family protein n=1 Tax=Aestuariibius sp. HNIBRBA575 TaxID=3233343 RepID=UPI0034A3FD09